MSRFEDLGCSRGPTTSVLLRSAVLAGAAGLLLAGCGGGGTSVGSVGDRFSQLFGGSSSSTNAQLVGTPPAPYGGGASAGPQGGPYQDCPGVAIREGASTLQIGVKPGAVTDNSELRYQGTITRNARDCTLFGGQVNTRVGIQGRIIVGPAGAPPAVDVPIRVAVVQEGASPKTVATKLYRTTVDLAGQDNVGFSFVAEDISFPVPTPEAVAAYVIYIGFDPEGARAPSPKQKGKTRG
jgi:hypothetical protein